MSRSERNALTGGHLVESLERKSPALQSRIIELSWICSPSGIAPLTHKHTPRRCAHSFNSSVQYAAFSSKSPAAMASFVFGKNFTTLFRFPLRSPLYSSLLLRFSRPLLRSPSLSSSSPPSGVLGPHIGTRSPELCNCRTSQIRPSELEYRIGNCLAFSRTCYIRYRQIPPGLHKQGVDHMRLRKKWARECLRHLSLHIIAVYR